MLHFVSGDLLLSNASMLGHGIAPNDAFHSGLALQLRERYPSMVRDFRHYCHAHHPSPGEAWFWAGSGPDGRTVRIANLLTQPEAPSSHAHPGRAEADYVLKALHSLRKAIEREKITSLALPRIATGVGGLEWKNVRPMVEKVFHDVTIPVYVYEVFHPGVKANEPELAAAAAHGTH